MLWVHSLISLSVGVLLNNQHFQVNLALRTEWKCQVSFAAARRDLMFGELCVEHQLDYLTLDKSCCCTEFYHICVIIRNMSGSTYPELRLIIALLLLFYYLLLSVFLSNVMPLRSNVFCFTANYRVWPALFQVTTVEGRLSDSGATWRFLRPLSCLLNPHTLHILTCEVGIEGLRTDDVVLCTDCKSHGGTVIGTQPSQIKLICLEYVKLITITIMMFL